MEGFIYHWTNNVNGKRYIGSHKGNIDDGYIGSGVAFIRAIKKYGIKNFTRTIIEECSVEKLKEREQYYLDLNNAAYDKNFYNIAPKAGGGWSHINNDPMNVQKIIASKKKNGTLNLSHTITDSTRKKMSISQSTAATIRKIEVYKFSLDGNFIEKFESMSAAARSVGAHSPGNIKGNCDGKFNNAHGYRWAYTRILPVISLDKIRGKKPIHTPYGIFPSVAELQRSLGIKKQLHVKKWCLSDCPEWADWYFVNYDDYLSYLKSSENKFRHTDVESNKLLTNTL